MKGLVGLLKKEMLTRLHRYREQIEETREVSLKQAYLCDR